ncbi:hypothetical protein C9374_004095 [Naegleria lovaniensis]|uniref:Uncharacterized protein n=1 Tax=Naegleria lovaniensis TaxID=51637 RepID=A0AA88GQQ3_NAELO|nr:uncharacterized protein C9374_004095 [Naegleria lovaniensis]KAG2383424.1 hypothetical protein C9374_004095 [Naegleria lovaniensis]
MPSTSSVSNQSLSSSHVFIKSTSTTSSGIGSHSIPKSPRVIHSSTNRPTVIHQLQQKLPSSPQLRNNVGGDPLDLPTSVSARSSLRILLPPIQQQQPAVISPSAILLNQSSNNIKYEDTNISSKTSRGDAVTPRQHHQQSNGSSVHHSKPLPSAPSSPTATPTSSKSFPLHIPLHNVHQNTDKEPQTIVSCRSKTHHECSKFASPRRPTTTASSVTTTTTKLQAPLSARVRKTEYSEWKTEVMKPPSTPPSKFAAFKSMSTVNMEVDKFENSSTASTINDDSFSQQASHLNSSRKSTSHERHWNIRIDRKLKDLEFFYSGGPTRVCHMKYLDDEDTSYYKNVVPSKQSCITEPKESSPKPSKKLLTPEAIEKRRKNKEKLKSINEKLFQCKLEIKKTQDQVSQRMEQLELLERLANKNGL